MRSGWIVLVLGGIVLAGCDSTPKKPESGRPASESGARSAEPEAGESVTVPRLCIEQMSEFFNRQQLVLADQIVIDASSDPFFGAVIAVTDKSAVEKIEAIDAKDRTTIWRLRNKTGQENLESVLPKVTIGDGMQVVATREILIRFHNRVRPARPIFLDMTATGRVVYRDTHRSDALRGPQMRMNVDVKAADGGYKFESRIR